MYKNDTHSDTTYTQCHPRASHSAVEKEPRARQRLRPVCGVRQQQLGRPAGRRVAVAAHHTGDGRHLPLGCRIYESGVRAAVAVRTIDVVSADRVLASWEGRVVVPARRVRRRSTMNEHQRAYAKKIAEGTWERPPGESDWESQSRPG
jgi:hypothetical protein